MPVINTGLRSDGSYNFDSIFRYLAPYSSSADYAAANLETTLCGTDKGYKYSGYPAFNCPDEIVDALKNAGFETVAMALSDQAVSLADPSLKNIEKLAVFFGNEENGLCEDTLRRIDHTAIIPMMHEMDSLNVAAAAAVTFWELCGSKTTEKA